MSDAKTPHTRDALMGHLRQAVWMRQQWRRFQQLLWGTLGAVWLLCCGGVLLADPDALAVRLALLLMLLVVTAYSLRLYLYARRERKELDRRAIDIRAEMTRSSASDPVSGRAG